MAITKETDARKDPGQETASARRIKYGLSVGILLVSLLLILGVINWLASDASRRFDLTAVGRYSLSAQTLKILNSLDETVTITALFAESDPLLSTDEQRAVAAQRRQVEDVLREFRSKSDKVEVVRLDPADPRTITKYDALIERLGAIHAEEIETYQSAIEAGRAGMRSLGAFASPQAEALVNAIGDLSPDHPSFRMLQRIIQVLSVMPQEMESLDKTAQQSLEADAMRGSPFPDLAGAASIVRAALQFRGSSLSQIADLFSDWIEAGDLPQPLADFLKPRVEEFRRLSSAALDQQERLNDLAPLKLTPITLALRQRNCVLLTTSRRSAVLPYDRLFRAPGALQAMEEGAGAVRRFAGETVIASGIRQLLLDERPNVIICHAEQQPTVLSGTSRGADFGALAEMLTDLGFYVREWHVSFAPKPTIEQKTGRPVWVIAPPAPNPQAMMPAAALVDAAKELVESGESVFIGLFPRIAAVPGQPDQWNAAIAPLGVEAETDRLVVERIPGPGGADQFAHGHDFVDYKGEHPVSAAVRGLPTRLDFAVPLRLLDAGSVQRTVLLDIAPNDRIWATDQFLQMPIAPPTTRDTAPYPILAAVERTGGFGTQRALVIGSAQWWYSAVVQEGDLRFRPPLPFYPGNAELFTAGVCWLAHLDELIARSPRAEAVVRIDNLSPGAQLFWRWALIGGLPVLSLAAGVAVAMARRG